MRTMASMLGETVWRSEQTLSKILDRNYEKGVMKTWFKHNGKTYVAEMYVCGAMYGRVVDTYELIDGKKVSVDVFRRLRNVYVEEIEPPNSE